MIGIKGMGGAGKTTLARAVFDQISVRFESKSFVENVREVTGSSLSGLKSLQQQILLDVLNEGVRVSGVGDGKNILTHRMRGRKVLIVLDDVDDIEQLEALAGDPKWFKLGSRIIITTRDEQVLLAHRVTLIRDVNLLSNEEAISLFSRYAFWREGQVDQGYEELAKQVVRYASGLPLTIKVLGSLLFGKDKPQWKDALQRLDKIPLKETLKILELSYTVLEDDQKEMFLDVACLMKGWRKAKAIKALESCGFHADFGLNILRQKCLISIDYNECVGMHDHIEEMGRNIVRRSHPDMPYKHSRLWKEEEIEHILANDLGTEETKCIRFNDQNVDPYVLIKGLGKMKALRFLYMAMGDRNRSLEFSRFSPSLSYALQYLSWKHYPFRSLPKAFQANNLVTLKMVGSNVVQLWEGGEHKVLYMLRFLDLSDSMSLRTFDLRLAPNLETLNLGGCWNLVELISDGMLTLKHLRSLELNYCKLLEKLPKDLCRLGCLEKLSLACTNIKHLPDWICNLKHLKYLYLGGCEFLEKLPGDLGHLECLEHLDLKATKITHLPNSICKLKRLNHLKLSGCMLLEKLPDDLGKLECLEYLDLSSTNIKHLPDSICKLKHLKLLNMEGTSISHLPQRILLLKGLHIYGSKRLLDMSVGFRSHLKTFEVHWGCYHIEV